MSSKIALGQGCAGYCQVISLDAYGAFPCADFQDSTGRWNPFGAINPPGKRFSSVAAGKGNQGNLQVILLGEDDHQPYFCWQAEGNGIWSAVAPLPGASHPAGYSAVAMAQGNSGNLQAILLGRDDHQPYLYWQAAGNGDWSGPVPLTAGSHAAGFCALSAFTGNDGNLQVVMLGQDDQQPYLYWQAAGNGIWTGPTPLAPSIGSEGYSALTLGTGNSGNLQLILIGKNDGQPYLYWQAAGNGIWTGPAPLTPAGYLAGFGAITAGPGNQGNLQVVAIARDTNQPYLYWQAAGNAVWTGPVPLLTEQLPSAIAEVQAFPAGSNLQVLFRPTAGNTLLVAWQGPQGNWHYYGELFHPTWMQEIASSITARKLTHLIIPGTHDSGTYGITTSSPYSPDAPLPSGVTEGGAEAIAAAATPFVESIPVVGTLLAPFVDSAASPAAIKLTYVNWAIAQGWNFRQQLRAGIRHFDLRVCKNSDGQFWIVHALYSVPVAEVLSAVSEFLSYSPQELITMDINHTFQMVAADDQALIGQIQAALGPWLASSSDFQPDSTVGEFWNSPARVIVTYYFNGRAAYGAPTIWQEHQQPPKGPQGSPPQPIPGPIVSQKWPDTTDLSTLQTKLSGYLQARKPNQLFVLQGIFTPANGQIAGGIVGGMHTLEALSAPATQAVISWLPGWAPTLNIVIVDHVENAPQYVRTVIRLNVEQAGAA